MDLCDLFASADEIEENKKNAENAKKELESLRANVQKMTAKWREQGLSGYWNGKVYFGNRVFIGNVEHVISDEQAEMLKKGCGFKSVEV